MENGAIALLLVVAIGVLFWRLSVRGPSRMRRSLYTIGALVLVLWLIAVVVNVLRTPGSA
jgi:succinate dehydrogenase/fumarate reductase cytochrome b subunit